MRLRERQQRQKQAAQETSAPKTSVPAAKLAVASRRERAKLATAAPVTTKQPRTFLVGTASVVSMLVLLVLVGAWGVGASLLLLFGDRMSEKLIAQSSEMQDGYEQRLQAYRAEVARLTLEIEQSRFDTTSVEGRVIELGRRQRVIEARLATLRRLSDMVGQQPGPPPLTATPPSRISFEGHGASLWRGDDEPLSPTLLHPAQALAAPEIESTSPDNSELDRVIQQIDRALLRTEQAQTDLVGLMRRSSEQRVSRIRAGFDLIGLTPEEALQLRGRGEAVLPNIVLPLSEERTPFADAIRRIRADAVVMQGFRPLVETLPVTRPTDSSIRYTSGFGFRVHPILGTRRLHAGIDMAAPVGAPVRAAGSGVVVSAGWGGGYGNLVQIDHGGGVLTRYAHLSQINVTANQPVARGALIGLMGSTGASTGSHLHFETRIRGVPVNPACFMQAGDRILGSQAIPFACDQPPSWRKSDRQEEEDDDS